MDQYGRPLTVRVVEAVAAVRGRSADELDDPLNDVVDVDALERLVSATDGVTAVTFEYSGCTVTVSSETAVEAVPTETV
jgi:hypothetical protein